MCDTLLAGVVKLRPRLPNMPKLDQVMFYFWEGRLAILQYYFRYVRLVILAGFSLHHPFDSLHLP